MNTKTKTHLVIPDCQIRPGVSTDFLEWIGQYIVHKQPNVIVQIGDFADMHSLSSYDKGTKAGEGARYELDIKSARDAMVRLLTPIWEYNHHQATMRKKQYKPRMILTMGNHENRINRHVNAYPVLDGRLSTNDLGYADFGWEVYDFLEVVEVDGILYSHYFPRNAAGKVVQNRSGAPNARLQVIREGQSCTSGHLQGLDFHVQQRANRRDYGLIAGSCYQHEEDYLTPQGTAYWRGIIMKNDVHDGNYDAMFVSLDFLERRYG